MINKKMLHYFNRKRVISFKTRSISYSTVCINKFSNFEFFRCCHISSKTCWGICFFLCRYILLHILHILYLQGAPGTPGLDVSHFETIFFQVQRLWLLKECIFLFPLLRRVWFPGPHPSAFLFFLCLYFISASVFMCSLQLCRGKNSRLCKEE